MLLYAKTVEGNMPDIWGLDGDILDSGCFS